MVVSIAQSQGQSVQPEKKPAYTLRHFDRQQVKQYLQNEEYTYDRNRQAEAPNLWARFWLWVYEKLFRHLFREGTGNYWLWGLYTFCALIIGWAIIRLTGSNIQGLFFGKGKSANGQFEESEANIHFIDFDKLITEAVNQGQYRRAVRLFYLRTLKHLSDREIIDWRPDKTNHDYLREWKRPDIEPAFRRLTFLFEYFCYGDFGIDHTRFEQTRQEFQDFENQIRKAA